MGFFDRFFKPPSKDKFAQMVMDGIRRAGETATQFPHVRQPCGHPRVARRNCQHYLALYASIPNPFLRLRLDIPERG